MMCGLRSMSARRRQSSRLPTRDIDLRLRSVEPALRQVERGAEALGSLASRVFPGNDNAVAWADAAQAAVTKNMDTFLAKAATPAGELKAIEDTRETVPKLKNVADTISAVKKAAEQYIKLSSSIKMEQYTGWQSATSQAGRRRQGLAAV